jgi:simple sugar transport system substrate-binding protein
MRKRLRALPLLLSGVILAAAGILPARAAGLPGAPAPFDQGDVKVALISLISQGDFFQAYRVGAVRQAKALGINLRLFPGNGDGAVERDAVQQAINLGVKAIIIDHGRLDTLSDLVNQALKAGIKVVAFDVNLNNPAIPQVEQSDKDLATLVLGQALKDNGTSFDAGLVFVAGFAPLDRRRAVWDDVLKQNPNIHQVAQWGSVSNPVATNVADQTAAVFRAHPDISVVFAPWDEFARGANLAVAENKLSSKVKIYSADISTADIQAIRAPDSAWVATAATNPAVVGEVSVRAAALLLAGQDPGHEILVEPALVTRDLLVKDNIQNVKDLEEKVPSFAGSSAATAAWIPVPRS